MKRKHFLILVWYVFIIWGSLTPNKNLPQIQLFPHFDKVVHAGFYFFLIILLIPACLKKSKYLYSYLSALIISGVTGIIFEILQYYIITGRTGSIFDVIANATGIVLGILFYQLLIREKKLEYIIFRIQ